MSCTIVSIPLCLVLYVEVIQSLLATNVHPCCLNLRDSLLVSTESHIIRVDSEMNLVSILGVLASLSVGATNAFTMSMSAKADLTYVTPPASDAASQISKPVQYPRDLYPELEPFDAGFLDVGDGHRLSYDVSGNPGTFAWVIVRNRSILFLSSTLTLYSTHSVQFRRYTRSLSSRRTRSRSKSESPPFLRP